MPEQSLRAAEERAGRRARHARVRPAVHDRPAPPLARSGRRASRGGRAGGDQPALGISMRRPSRREPIAPYDRQADLLTNNMAAMKLRSRAKTSRRRSSGPAAKADRASVSRWAPASHRRTLISPIRAATSPRRTKRCGFETVGDACFVTYKGPKLDAHDQDAPRARAAARGGPKRICRAAGRPRFPAGDDRPQIGAGPLNGERQDCPRGVGRNR